MFSFHYCLHSTEEMTSCDTENSIVSWTGNSTERLQLIRLQIISSGFPVWMHLSPILDRILAYCNHLRLPLSSASEFFSFLFPWISSERLARRDRSVASRRPVWLIDGKRITFPISRFLVGHFDFQRHPWVEYTGIPHRRTPHGH